MAKKRWPMVFGGLLAASAAAGAASALVRRRRSRRSWDEYGDDDRTVRTQRGVAGSPRPTASAGVDKVSTAAKEAKDRAGDLVGTRRHAGRAAGGSGVPGENKQPYAPNDPLAPARSEPPAGSAPVGAETIE